MKMKRLKKFAATLTAVALCALLPGGNAMSVSADSPVTYYIKYDAEEDDLCFQVGKWNKDVEGRELYYMYQDMKDGDIVVVDSEGYDDYLTVALNKRLSNLTVTNNSRAVVSAPSIDVFYGNGGSSSAITGDIGTAYVYDDANATFHSNVSNLEIIDTRGQLTGTVTVGGIAGHVTCKTESNYIYFELYNVAAGKLLIDYGTLKTDASQYSTTPDAAQTTTAAAPAATTTTTTTESSASTQQSSTASSDYDDVPKTGDSSTILWLVGIAALCLTGRRALKRV